MLGGTLYVTIKQLTIEQYNQQNNVTSKTMTGVLS